MILNFRILNQVISDIDPYQLDTSQISNLMSQCESACNLIFYLDYELSDNSNYKSDTRKFRDGLHSALWNLQYNCIKELDIRGYYDDNI